VRVVEQKALAFVLVQGKEQLFQVQGEYKDAVIEALKKFNEGDLLTLEVMRETGRADSLKSVSVKTVSVSRWRRLFVLSASLLLFWGAMLVLVRTRFPKLLVGEDGRHSNSKFQINIWLGVVFGSYVAAVWLRLWACDNCFIAGIDIPDHLLMLSGISAVTFGAAKAITSAKIGANPKAKELAAGEKPSLVSNLTANDKGSTDLGDIQMLIIVLLAVVIYLLEVFKFLGTVQCFRVVSLPDVDTTLLTLFGLGQGAYLAKKAGGKAGES